MDTGGNQVVTGTLGGGLGQNGSLDLQEAVFVEVVAGHLGDLVTGGDGVLHLGTAQIQITVLQTQHVVGVGVLNDLEGRGLGLCQQAQLGDIHLDVAGGDLVGLALALADEAGDGHDILAAQSGGLFKNGLVGAVVEGQLNQTGAVTQIHKDQTTQVTLALDPAAQANGLAGIADAQVAAVVAAGEILQIIHKIQLRFVLFINYIAVCTQMKGLCRGKEVPQGVTEGTVVLCGAGAEEREVDSLIHHAPTVKGAGQMQIPF